MLMVILMMRRRTRKISVIVLKRLSYLLIMQAHERNLNTDVLIGLLSRIAPLRNTKARDCALKVKQGHKIDAKVYMVI
jgi:hypothetical protein